MADVWWAPIPRCPDHGGPMRHDFATCRWVCRGWDGEGCPYTVTDEEQAAGLRPLGTTGQVAAARAGPQLCDPDPWADPGHDVLADLRAARRPAPATVTFGLAGCTLHDDPACTICYVLSGGV